MMQRKHGNVDWHLSSVMLVGAGLCLLTSIAACSLFNQGRSVYDQAGIRIGLEADPSVRPSGEAGLNNHPINLSPKNLEVLLQPIYVTGYSGTITGLLTKPQPVPLFTLQELTTITEHLASAFREATPTERVFFSLPKPGVAYSEDRTVGSLFFRGPHLHIIVTDHSSIIRTDTSGGDYKDFWDTKGMKLWVTGPAHAAVIPELDEPRWAPFEKVHISLMVNELLARKETAPSVRTKQERTDSPASLPTATSLEPLQGSTSPKELHRQMRELSDTNQELKDQLDEQNKRMEQLQKQVEQLQREMPDSNLKGQP